MATGLTINIYAGSDPVPIVDIKPTPKQKAPSPEPKDPPKVDKDVERGDALDVELLARDDLDDAEKIDLEQRIVLYVRELLSKKKSSTLRSFLDKAKHHLEPTMKESISEEIRNVKKDL